MSEQKQEASVADPADASDIEEHHAPLQREASTPFTTLAFGVVCVAIAGFHIWANIYGRLPTLWLTGIHFAGFALLGSLIYPMLRLRQGESGAAASKALLIFDGLFGLAVATATLVLVAQENAVYERGVRLSWVEWTAAFIVLVGALELTRRTAGIIIPIIIFVAITYPAFWGGWLDGVFKFTGLSLETIVFRSIYTDEGMFGIIANISATFVFMFILFGAFLCAPARVTSSLTWRARLQDGSSVDPDLLPSSPLVSQAPFQGLLLPTRCRLA